MARNLLSELPPPLPEEFVEILARGGRFRLERIVSSGHASPPGFWYDQPEREWVVVLSGAARVLFDDGETVNLETGGWVDISAHRRHRVEWTDPDRPTVWLALHYS
jgi:cupin 2 domain-containing protein